MSTTDGRATGAAAVTTAPATGGEAGAPRAPDGGGAGAPPPRAGAGLTAPFWEAAADGVLVRPVCGRCGRSFFVPQWACPHCHSEVWSYRPSSGRGVVYSHTTVHRGPDRSWTVPYVLAIVDVEEGWHLLTRLEGFPPGDEEPGELIGQPVQVAFVDDGRHPGRRLPVFVPVASRQAAAERADPAGQALRGAASGAGGGAPRGGSGDEEVVT